MAPIDDNEQIAVRRGPDGAVLVGPVPACPAGRVVVGVPGGEVHLDPAAPDGPPLAVLREPEEAGTVVAELFGPEAPPAVRLGDATLLWTPGPGWDAVRRAGLSRWLHRHAPDVLSETLLDLEFGVAASAVELSDDELADAATLLGDRAGAVVRLSRLLREPGRPDPPSGVPELLAAAADAALEQAALDATTAADLEHERELAAALTRFGGSGSTIDWTALAAIPEVGGRELAGAGAAGGEPGSGEFRGSVDWYQVPRGVLDTTELTVTWTLDGDVLEVSVLARPGGPDHGGLAFRVYAPDDPFPLGRSALRRSPDGTRFRGRTVLRATTAAAGRLSVDVFDATDRRRPRLGVEAVRARAVRWSTRAVTLVRLAGTGVRADDVAAEALHEAEALYDEVAEDHRDEEHRDAAQRCAARCAGLRRAVLLRDGQERQATAIGREWTDVEAPVMAADVAVPDLDGAGWRPLAAEHALRSDEVWRP